MAGSIPLITPTNPRIMVDANQRRGIDGETDVALACRFQRTRSTG